MSQMHSKAPFFELPFRVSSNRRPLVPATVLIPIVALMQCSSIKAAEADYSISIGVDRSDNVGLDATDEVEETIPYIGANINLTHESRRISAELHADLEYRTYSDDSFDNENFSSFAGRLDFGFVPDRFNWFFSDSFGKIVSDPFRSAAPDNRENVNIFSTGPALIVPLGRRTSINVSGTFTQTNYEISDIDNSRSTGLVALQRALSPNRNIALNISQYEVEYDADQQDSDYDVTSGYVSFSSRLSDSELSLKAGVTEIQSGDQKSDGYLAGISLSRQLSPSTTFLLSFDQQFSDAGDLFKQVQSDSPDLRFPDDIAASSEPFLNKRVVARWGSDRETRSLFLSLFWNDAGYEYDATLDRNGYGIQFGGTRRFNSRWEGGANVRWQTSELTSDTQYDDVTSTLFLGYWMSGKTSIRLNYKFENRSSNIPDQEYDENRIGISLTYNPTK